MTRLEELRQQRKALEVEIAQEEERSLANKQQKVVDKINSLTEDQKNTILGLMTHSCLSCSDGRPQNGWSWSSGSFRCHKCMLIEILNGEHGGEFDFTLDVSVSKVTP